MSKTKTEYRKITAQEAFELLVKYNGSVNDCKFDDVDEEPSYCAIEGALTSVNPGHVCPFQSDGHDSWQYCWAPFEVEVKEPESPWIWPDKPTDADADGLGNVRVIRNESGNIDVIAAELAAFHNLPWMTVEKWIDTPRDELRILPQGYRRGGQSE